MVFTQGLSCHFTLTLRLKLGSNKNGLKGQVTYSQKNIEQVEL